MPTLAIDQHERLVGREAAQRRRAQRIGAIRQGRLRKIERRNQLVENLVGFGLARGRKLIATDDVDRDRGFGNGASGNT